jgi:hypothetical protein
MGEPHADQENDEVPIDVCRVTAPLDFHSHPSPRVTLRISMDLERRVAP